ncbi:AEC family transporter [Aerococcus urinae]|uniref:AEC family transporter n=1 Tax=Aerococcus TaxID=1375 RepID=UPI0018A725EC|nr:MULTISPECIES: AEC family transporter [Aerococcus]MCY3036252.1 AEC family transporter [Aerococcus sp. Group 2]MDK6520266.1 AEC family transporter [Aerococcus urinae]
MSFGEILIATLTNMKFISAITSTIGIILIGYICRRRGVFNQHVSKVLSTVVLKLAIPCMAFNAFMQDLNVQQLHQSMSVLVWGLLIYLVFIVITRLTYARYEGDTKLVLRMLTIFGSTTFFGIPIVSAVYGADGVIYANVFNIGYRIFLYSYCYILMSGLQFKKSNLKSIFLNPTILFTLAGLLIWAMQAYLPHVTVETLAKTGEMVERQAPILRFDLTLPWLYQLMNYLSKLASPLAWLSIGATLGESELAEAVKDNKVWYYAFNKMLIVPLITLVCGVLFTVTNTLPMDYAAIGTTVVMMATPPASVAVSYAIGFGRESKLASNASFVTTLTATLAIPIWLVVIEVLKTSGVI